MVLDYKEVAPPTGLLCTREPSPKFSLGWCDYHSDWSLPSLKARYMRVQVFVVAQELVLRGRRLSISSCGTAKQTFSIQNSGNELKLDRIQSNIKFDVNWNRNAWVIASRAKGKDAILTRRGFKVRRLHKHFLAWFWGRGNKQTSYIVNQVCLRETSLHRVDSTCYSPGFAGASAPCDRHSGIAESLRGCLLRHSCGSFDDSPSARPASPSPTPPKGLRSAGNRHIHYGEVDTLNDEGTSSRRRPPLDKHAERFTMWLEATIVYTGRGAKTSKGKGGLLLRQGIQRASPISFADLSYLANNTSRSLLHEAASQKDLRLIELAVLGPTCVFGIAREIWRMTAGKDNHVHMFFNQFANHDTALLLIQHQLLYV
ncbi:uncharacterized protein LACBIDRAFT_324771 [Laccaria bicolor S238N-H82]|uniref:Predicted protein n=1 Tax=Laccaria bicolor (strain S238N-H82 / ATCC MYA-4686) TaxID=486041 RepID=B0D2Z9_LACBS|nr:uncharacterized protein LACBIDRAFT_324771 [Laccaria bicolor S238N-H82]EDR11185.1 predicted protein [Laccaria bicolor S238N-H82]|eukprot:XP_001878486.1 predicted protein [Laccaria bicolor S238N-H82]